MRQLLHVGGSGILELLRPGLCRLQQFVLARLSVQNSEPLGLLFSF